MNANDIKDLRDVKEVIGAMEKTFTSTEADIKLIKHCLMGKPDDNDDLGLVGDVRNNKRWRGNVNKSLCSIGITSVGLLARQIFELFKRGG